MLERRRTDLANGTSVIVLAVDRDLDLRQRRGQRHREGLHLLRAVCGVEVVVQAVVGDARRVVAAFAWWAPRAQAADVAEAGRRSSASAHRRTIGAGLADEDSAGAPISSSQMSGRASSHRARQGRSAIAAEGDARHLVRVVGRTDVADDGLERLRAARTPRSLYGFVQSVRRSPAEADPSLPRRCWRRAEGTGRRTSCRRSSASVSYIISAMGLPHIEQLPSASEPSRSSRRL